MPKFYDANNQELSPGQALDVWLERVDGLLSRDKYSGKDFMSANVHLFADAIYGYPNDVSTLSCAGIEIRFEEKV